MAARTFAMTTIAALSLFVGVSGILGSAAVIGDGLGVTHVATVTRAPSVGTTTAPPPAPGIDARMVLFGSLRAVLSLLLVAGGVGTLWVRPSGRRLSLAFAVGWILLGAVEPFALGYAFGWPVVTSALYPFLLLAVFNSPGWRAAFSPRPAPAGPPGAR